MGIRSSQLALAIVLLFLICTTSYCAQYTITTANIYNPTAINNSGQVTGQYVVQRDWHAGIWSTQGTTVLKPTYTDNGYAFDINDHGQIAGYSDGSGAYWENGTASPIRIDAPNSYHTQANSINNNGEIVGYTNIGAISRGFIWQGSGTTLLDTLGGSDSWAGHINNNGLVSGHADSVSSDMLPCIWQDNTVTQLQMLSGYTRGQSNYSNDLGQIVGRCLDTYGNNRASLWNSVTGAPIDLGVLQGKTSSQAKAINKFGQIVGFSYSGGALRATLWQNNILYDLNTMLPENSGWELLRAEDINDSGQIVGTGLYNGQQKTFVLTQVPEPSSLITLLCGMGAICGVIRRKR